MFTGLVKDFIQTIILSDKLYHFYFNFQLYDKNELLQNKLDILNKTNMVDYAIDIHQYLYEHKPIPEVSINIQCQKTMEHLGT